MFTWTGVVLTIFLGVVAGLITGLLMAPLRIFPAAIKQNVRRWRLMHWRSNPREIQLEFTTNPDLFGKQSPREECLRYEEIASVVQKEIGSTDQRAPKTGSENDAVTYIPGGTAKPNDAVWNRHVKPEVDRLVRWADYHWGRPNPRQRLFSSWRYALAGQYCELTENYDDAGLYYHFAANQFRAIGQLDQGIEYYKRSAILYAKAYEKHGSEDSLKMANRSAQRAIGITAWVGETKLLWDDLQSPAEIRKAVGEISPTILQPSTNQTKLASPDGDNLE
ncbi:MAG: hypothetical protein AAGD43_30880 [Pseudomonadota bacterium]